MTASYEVRDGRIAVLAMDNPPVNSLGLGNRRFIADSVLRAQADPQVEAIVLTGQGRAFCGGADIREFNRPEATTAPDLVDVIRLVEGCDKPVVAAIHGVVMGGGLELAMGCHYRVVQAGTQVALPEVRIGILPGATGTQRLPRLIGLEAALNMIVSGDTVMSEALFAMPDQRLFDRLVPDNVLEAAIAFAREKALVRPLPRARELRVTHPDAEGYLHFARTAVAAAWPHCPAPLRCLDCVAQSVRLPFDAAVEYERAAVTELVWTPESAALRHAFFSERVARKAGEAGNDAIAERMLGRARRAASALRERGVPAARIEAAMRPYGLAQAVAADAAAAERPSLSLPLPLPLPLSERQIAQRVFQELAEEGARLIKDGIAANASQIDHLFVSKLGFPRWHGGPMHCAEREWVFEPSEVKERVA